MSRRMSDEYLLWLILTNTIVIRKLWHPKPDLYVNGRFVKPILNEQGGKKRIFGGKRYRWKIQHEGRCRRIMCSKLVWMYVHQCIIPDDCRIHHESKGHLNDSIGNLDMMTYEDHQRHHYPSLANKD